MRYFSSIVLEVIRCARLNPSLTLGEIEQAVRNRISEENIPRGQHRWFLDPGMKHETRLFKVREALIEAEELGLVTPIDSTEELNDKQRWRIADTWQPPYRSGSDGGGGGNGRSGIGRGDEDGDEGGGLIEALSHPVLFSLDEEDFEAIVDGLFAEGRS